ncbi:hypothetical protein [Pontibacter sp. G13]|uniref:hypothetical protein n=1 Tax=Pontibacter sp. G13 TaxID=3074898 RepID=UPI002889253F|nr:hypothetical protein [Pontibacter sp. G13]WNJ19072.1 hypothetical protein RJD25_01155 [Pontibacter sp. G13]
MKIVKRSIIVGMVGLCLVLGCQETPSDSCQLSTFNHVENLNHALWMLDSLIQLGQQQVKDSLRSEYDFIVEQKRTSAGTVYDTIPTSEINIVPQWLRMAEGKGLGVSYSYHYSDTSEYLNELYFVEVGIPKRKTDFLYPPDLQLMSWNCHTRLVSRYDSAYREFLNPVHWKSEHHPEDHWYGHGISIHISELSCMRTSDICLLYMLLSNCNESI